MKDVCNACQYDYEEACDICNKFEIQEKRLREMNEKSKTTKASKQPTNTLLSN